MYTNISVIGNTWTFHIYEEVEVAAGVVTNGPSFVHHITISNAHVCTITMYIQYTFGYINISMARLETKRYRER